MIMWNQVNLGTPALPLLLAGVGMGGWEWCYFWMNGEMNGGVEAMWGGIRREAVAFMLTTEFTHQKAWFVVCLCVFGSCESYGCVSFLSKQQSESLCPKIMSRALSGSIIMTHLFMLNDDHHRSQVEFSKAPQPVCLRDLECNDMFLIYLYRRWFVCQAAGLWREKRTCLLLQRNNIFNVASPQLSVSVFVT